jgi:hypothetical protein
MIDVLKIQGLDHEGLLRFLSAKGGPEYKIRIPRSGQLPSDRDNEKAFDYLRAAYVGQELHDVSEEFNYNPIEPEEEGDIVFEIQCSNTEELANKLLGISFLFGQARASEDSTVAMVINTLLDRIRDERMIPACGHFIEYYIDLTV